MKTWFAKDAWMFVLPLLGATIILFATGVAIGAWLTLGLALFCLYFFRDPTRVPPEGDDLIVAPADGRVVKIDREYKSPDHPEGCICISTFLSIFNVHIQRVPIAGAITAQKYNKGKFLAAWDHKASLDNEQNMITLDTAIGVVCVKQIAGLIARRIITWVDVDDKLERADRYGLIRFGSRVDLIVPDDVEVVCKVGDKVAGGETVMFRVAKGTSDKG